MDSLPFLDEAVHPGSRHPGPPLPPLSFCKLRQDADLTLLTVPALKVYEAEADVRLEVVLAGAPVLARIRGALVPICGGVSGC